MSRIHNFSAGPAVLPEPVLSQAREAIWELGGSGLGLLECSHRSDLFESVIGSARTRIRTLMQLGDDQEVLFLQGGAQSQFFMVPMNLLRGQSAGYLDTGTWADKAAAEARRYGTVDVLFSGRDASYRSVPEANSWGNLRDGTVYLHYTSNNTVAGTQYSYVPDPGSALLVCDGSSDMVSKPIDGSKFDIFYAGAQKNLGPSGVTVVIIRRSLLERCDPEIPTMLRYGVHVNKGSMYNTPNTFGIYVIDQVCKWIMDTGGLAAMGARNQAQATQLYDLIDGTDFWTGKADHSSRSAMNVTFTTGDEALDTRFWKSAAEEGFSGLKGHRIVGGLRASIYNAQRDESVQALADYMAHFEATHG